MTPFEKKIIDEHFTDSISRERSYSLLDAGGVLAYIIGEWYFYDEVYKITPDVLVPQSDTEILVEKAIKTLPAGCRFIDICTGSGCIAISVLKHRPDTTAVAVDISEKAVEIARTNAELNGVDSRIKVLQADIFDNRFAETVGESFDALLSNPPYIESEVIPTLSAQVKAEPHIALDGGTDGLDFYRRIKQLIPLLLKRNTPYYLEIGYNQAQSVNDIFDAGKIIKDYGGNDRVFVSIC